MGTNCAPLVADVNIGSFDEWLHNFRALFCVYTQLKDVQGKNEQCCIYVLKIGSGDKKRSIKCQGIHVISVFKS